MGRPNKAGLEYFYLDVKLDDEAELIEATHGHEGFVTMIKLFMKIYGHSYFLEWSEKQRILFAKKVNIAPDKVQEIVDDCIKWELFDESLYEKYRILTSARIQNHYAGVTYKRSEVTMHRQYLLVDISNKSHITVSDIENKVSDDGNSVTNVVSDDESTQSKVKESKEKEKDHIPYAAIVNHLNEKVNGSFKSTSQNTKKCISARFNDGFQEEDFYEVIDYCAVEWSGKKFGNGKPGDFYLKPDTLFNGNFENRLHEAKKSKEIKPTNINKKKPKTEYEKQLNLKAIYENRLSYGYDYYEERNMLDVYERAQEDLARVNEWLGKQEGRNNDEQLRSYQLTGTH